MEEKKQEKTKKKIVFYLIPILIFVVFIGYMMIRTFTGEVKAAVTETTLSVEGFEHLSDSFEDVLQENMFAKNEYINLNGLTTRVLGINSLNERQKLRNGYLASFSNAGNTSDAATNVIELDQFLDDHGIEFIYLLAPTKSSFYNAEFAPGYSSTEWMNIDSMISTLDESGVITIDMNAWFEENEWTMENVFFKTDHHWRPQAGLAAANVTMELLSEMGLADYQEELLQEENYTIETLHNWFLGSDGKRVGKFYAGVDDIDVFFPNFPTGYTLIGLDTDTTNWHYWDSLLNLSYTENKDYFNSDPHCIYFYYNQPIQITTNTEALNDKRVLIIGDSFHRMLKYFLATQFTEIYSVDLRYYTDGTLTEYIEEIQPDIVLMCTDSATSAELYSFRVDEYNSALEKTSISKDDALYLGDIIISAQENSNNFSVITTELKVDQTYTLTVDSTAYSGGEDLFVQMTLQDLSTNKAVYNRYFDANSDKPQKWIFSIPEGDDTYAIYLYAGTKGHTQNTTAGVSDIILYEGIIEN